jgi:hypothetical protein
MGRTKPAYRRARFVPKSQSPHPTPLRLPPPSLLRPCLGSRSGPGQLGPGLSARAVTALLAPGHIRMPSAHNSRNLAHQAARPHSHPGEEARPGPRHPAAPRPPPPPGPCAHAPCIPSLPRGLRNRLTGVLPFCCAFAIASSLVCMAAPRKTIDIRSLGMADRPADQIPHPSRGPPYPRQHHANGTAPPAG